MTPKFFREFTQLESASGIILCATAILGLLLANSPAYFFYHALLTTPITFQISQWQISFSNDLFINDGLMVLFFLLVGLEIKREILVGELNAFNKILIPGIAALAGMIIPAMIYLLYNYNHPELLRGWAIPTATDIAFALAVLNLLGNRVPVSIKIFLTTLAIFDDLGAIIIIAIFYTKKIAWIYLITAVVIFLLLCVLNHRKINKLSLYFILGGLLWWCICHTGIHPTIAGVLLATTIPLYKDGNINKSPLSKLEHGLHPWVAFLVLPLFAFGNMGIQLNNLKLSMLFSSLPMGIFLGLFLGKQLGIFSAVWLSIKYKLGSIPEGANWRMIYGISLLAGIGFTMSLFIGDLAFGSRINPDLIRLGVLLGSLFSGLFGYLFIRYSTK